jgi:hypothetical protein
MQRRPNARRAIQQETGRPMPLSLAPQGGGSLWAFTWDVLDGLLEEDRLAFDAISGTNAGTVNAVVLAAGFAVGGREGPGGISNACGSGLVMHVHSLPSARHCCSRMAMRTLPLSGSTCSRA